MKPIDWGNACIEATKLNIEANKRIDAIASILLLASIFNLVASIQALPQSIGFI